MVDNEIREMPGNGDYPKFMEKENKQKFYDPGLKMGEDQHDSATVNLAPFGLASLLCINCFALLFFL